MFRTPGNGFSHSDGIGHVPHCIETFVPFICCNTISAAIRQVGGLPCCLDLATARGGASFRQGSCHGGGIICGSGVAWLSPWAGSGEDGLGICQGLGGGGVEFSAALLNAGLLIEDVLLGSPGEGFFC
jgi:hypothetical protein